MKKILGILLITVTLLLAGCTGESNKMQKFEKAMEEYGKNYYETYVTSTGLNRVEITLGKLKEAVEKANANYDLSKLNGCTENSMVILVLKSSESREIERVEYQMNCK